jgi:hypothetical protein
MGSDPRGGREPTFTVDILAPKFKKRAREFKKVKKISPGRGKTFFSAKVHFVLRLSCLKCIVSGTTLKIALQFFLEQMNYIGQLIILCCLDKAGSFIRPERGITIVLSQFSGGPGTLDFAAKEGPSVLEEARPNTCNRWNSL